MIYDICRVYTVHNEVNQMSNTKQDGHASNLSTNIVLN